MDSVVDLRSDTVTRPTPAMRRAMAEAPVGDDVFGDDPTVAELERIAAERVGKAAAMFVPSGTMANLTAVMTHAGRGDEILLGEASHIFLSEGGGSAGLAGVQPRPIPNQPDGTLDLEQVAAAVRTPDVHHPISRLLCLENTHNRCGGSALTVEYTRAAGDLARRHGLRLHLDGARLFNAAVALEVEPRRLAEPADSVAFCLSKGLCAPIGSLLCGEAEFIGRARRTRKQLGGGMRQVGVVAAAGIVSLTSMVDRLADDHARARRMAESLRTLPGVSLETDPPSTNMIFFTLDERAAVDGAGLEAALRQHGILIHRFGVRRIRLVLHHDIDDDGVERSVEALRAVLGKGG